MSKNVMDDANEEPLEKLRTLQLSTPDEDDTLLHNERGANFDDDDDEDDEEEDVEQVPVALGFLEQPKHHWSLLRQLFPSKAGGIPAWLDPINLPTGKSCLCDICGDPLQFMLQIYAPLLENESTFHRTLLLFMCPSMRCLLQDQHEQWKRNPQKPLRSVKVFRCQLPRVNTFYSNEAPRSNGTDKPKGNGAALCHWCGTWIGDKVCSSCKKVRYCSEKHQAVHWRSDHKTECQQICISTDSSKLGSSGASSETKAVACDSLWPEYEIINEDEDEDDEMLDSSGSDKMMVSRSELDETYKSLIDGFEGDGDKKSWATFEERIFRAPEQVLRYCRYAKAKPLWPMSSGRPSKADIPKCDCCGGLRVFEFQVLPQLLYYFHVKNDANSLDWATIVVYTCQASCDANVSYKEEFPWVQLATQSTVSISE